MYSATTDRTTGVLCDQRVMLNGYYSAKKYREHLRRIRFKDPDSGKTLIFLTNNTALPALTISVLHKSRRRCDRRPPAELTPQGSHSPIHPTLSIVRFGRTLGTAAPGRLQTVGAAAQITRKR